MFRTRVITALLGIPLVAGAIYLGSWWFFILIFLAALICGWEFDRMMSAGKHSPIRLLILGLIALLLLDRFLFWDSWELILSLAVFGGLIWQLFRKGSHSPTADWALSITGGLYIGWSLAHLVGLRQLPNGLAWVWLAFLATWGADTFAYLAGSAWGRHKIWPRLSPKKSWEGLLGGIAGGLLGTVIVILFFGLRWESVLALGVIAPIAGFFGDISESMMKRDVNVKDSSHILPGHGGLLDRIDGLLFVSIVVYYYAVWIG